MDTQVRASISLRVEIILDESEARALDAIFGYSPQAFIDGFYAQLGSHYLKPHAHAVPGLFRSVKQQLCPALKRVDDARKKFNMDNKNGR